MPKLLSGYIAKQLGRKLGPHVKPATLIKVTSTARTAGAVSAGLNPTETSYAARGWIEEWNDEYVEGSTSRRRTRLVALLGATIAGGQVPVTGDKVTIEGTTYRVVGIGDGEQSGRDPDSAVWLCRVVA